ncbi:DNA-binding transcriptional LysR family regulator [Sphingomonas kaistensis]|uniref:DNA-binding transcriptional LysR family regulator n=1 Tax=Sphingomonas kaistensis TaxID=298708 RepID=A0A7X5Y349_9SPHN|nr:LysR family transcriptional regulator [Sphingomonas kaistensis]NJC04317.1 DNA-binding transcriptional LysR family regulator [Sphingomonas kaistensis]
MAREPEWSDWRVFLAVAKHGSTLGAGKALRMSQSTAARRITALEEALAVRLFERRAQGYRLTDAGEAVLPLAQALEGAAVAAEGRARAQARALGGTVRITSEEVFAVTLLTPWLRELHLAHPEIRIELDSSRELRDLGAGEADIALRSTSKAQPEGLVGRVLQGDDWALYCSRDYAAQHGLPHNRHDLLHHNIIGGGGGGLWRVYSGWLEEMGLLDRVTMQYDGSNGLLSGIKSGLGVGVLPCIVARADSDLLQCLRPMSQHDRKLWLLTHERVRHNPNVRLVADFLYERLMRHIRATDPALNPPPEPVLRAAP